MSVHPDMCCPNNITNQIFEPKNMIQSTSKLVENILFIISWNEINFEWIN